MPMDGCSLESDGAGIFLSGVYFGVLTLDNKGDFRQKVIFLRVIIKILVISSVVLGTDGSFQN